MFFHNRTSNLPYPNENSAKRRSITGMIWNSTPQNDDLGDPICSQCSNKSDPICPRKMNNAMLPAPQSLLREVKEWPSCTRVFTVQAASSIATDFQQKGRRPFPSTCPATVEGPISRLACVFSLVKCVVYPLGAHKSDPIISHIVSHCLWTE